MTGVSRADPPRRGPAYVDGRSEEKGVATGSRTTPEGWIDTYAVSGARALRRAGWSDERIAEAYGNMPPIHMSPTEVREHNARVGPAGDERPALPDEAFQGDP